MKPVCFLHIGIHKTGTTSIQKLLSSNEQCLEQNGVFIPRSGVRYRNGGHHNLAWDLIGDARFDPAYGTWQDALSEICSFDPPAVCLSCEEFALLYPKPDSLCRIRQDLNSIGYQVTIIVYLRPQADYIESMYVEDTKYDTHIAGFREYLGDILQSGANTHRRPRFEYDHLLDIFAKAFGPGRIVVRPYDASRKPEYLLNDFISVISQGRQIRGLDLSAYQKRLNPSLSFAEVVELLLANRRKSGEGNFEPSSSSIPDGDFMQGRFDPLDLRDLIRIHRRFRKDNRALRKKYQVKIPTMSWPRLREELKCALGLNRHSTRRKNLLSQLDARDKLPRAP
jgi:hypothetical protein